MHGDDPIIDAAFKGIDKGTGKYKYDFLEYFDSCEEKDNWLELMSTIFKRKRDAQKRAPLSNNENENPKRQKFSASEPKLSAETGTGPSNEVLEAAAMCFSLRFKQK